MKLEENKDDVNWDKETEPLQSIPYFLCMCESGKLVHTLISVQNQQFYSQEPFCYSFRSLHWTIKQHQKINIILSLAIMSKISMIMLYVYLVAFGTHWIRRTDFHRVQATLPARPISPAQGWQISASSLWEVHARSYMYCCQMNAVHYSTAASTILNSTQATKLNTTWSISLSHFPKTELIRHSFANVHSICTMYTWI